MIAKVFLIAALLLDSTSNRNIFLRAESGLTLQHVNPEHSVQNFYTKPEVQFAKLALLLEVPVHKNIFVQTGWQRISTANIEGVTSVSKTGLGYRIISEYRAFPLRIGYDLKASDRFSFSPYAGFAIARYPDFKKGLRSYDRYNHSRSDSLYGNITIDYKRSTSIFLQSGFYSMYRIKNGGVYINTFWNQGTFDVNERNYNYSVNSEPGKATIKDKGSHLGLMAGYKFLLPLKF